MYFELKRSYWKFDLRSRSWPNREGSCCVSVDPYRQPEHIYGVFTALDCLYKRLLPKKTAGVLSWPGVTSTTWGEVTGRNIPIHCVKFTFSRCLRVFRMIFVQKRRLSIFSRWLIMERSKNWPCLRSPISKLRDNHFICWYGYQLWQVPRRSVSRCIAMTRIQAVYVFFFLTGILECLSPFYQLFGRLGWLDGVQKISVSSAGFEGLTWPLRSQLT